MVTQRVIVVGFDGSEHGWRALGWVARAARLRATRLVVVHVFDLGIAGMEPTTGWTLDAFAHEAKEVLDRGVATRATKASERRVCSSTGQQRKHWSGRPRGPNCSSSAAGRGGLAGAPLGSVSTACLHHALCPVVVVPPPDRAGQARTDGAEAHLVKGQGAGRPPRRTLRGAVTPTA